MGRIVAEARPSGVEHEARRDDRGGAFSGSGSIRVSLNTAYPSPTGWTPYMNNANSGAADFFRTYVICAGTYVFFSSPRDSASAGSSVR
jgi:hypothetical protein